ncbi:hypothetical protein CB0940_00082, partial [Cercospora beticola]
MVTSWRARSLLSTSVPSGSRGRFGRRKRAALNQTSVWRYGHGWASLHFSTDGQRQELHVHLLGRVACMVIDHGNAQAALRRNKSHDFMNFVAMVMLHHTHDKHSSTAVRVLTEKSILCTSTRLYKVSKKLCP